jgi:hypothetical protein
MEVIRVILYGTQAWKITTNNDRTLAIAETLFHKLLAGFTQNMKGRVEIVKRNRIDFGRLI